MKKRLDGYRVTFTHDEKQYDAYSFAPGEDGRLQPAMLWTNFMRGPYGAQVQRKLSKPSPKLKEAAARALNERFQ